MITIKYESIYDYFENFTYGSRLLEMKQVMDTLEEIFNGGHYKHIEELNPDNIYSSCVFYSINELTKHAEEDAKLRKQIEQAYETRNIDIILQLIEENQLDITLNNNIILGFHDNHLVVLC